MGKPVLSVSYRPAYDQGSPVKNFPSLCNTEGLSLSHCSSEMVSGSHQACRQLQTDLEDGFSDGGKVKP